MARFEGASTRTGTLLLLDYHASALDHTFVGALVWTGVVLLLNDVDLLLASKLQLIQTFLSLDTHQLECLFLLCGLLNGQILLNIEMRSGKTRKTGFRALNDIIVRLLTHRLNLMLLVGRTTRFGRVSA